MLLSRTSVRLSLPKFTRMLDRKRVPLPEVRMNCMNFARRLFWRISPLVLLRLCWHSSSDVQLQLAPLLINYLLPFDSDNILAALERRREVNGKNGVSKHISFLIL